MSIFEGSAYLEHCGYTVLGGLRLLLKLNLSTQLARLHQGRGRQTPV